MKKIISIVLLLSFIFSFSGCKKESDEACAWCDKSPSIEYTTSTGAKSYVCEKCSSTCMICEKKAVTHFTNAFEQEVFVCADCYKEIEAAQE